MNTQVKTWLGVVIIIIIAFTVGAFVWRAQENKSNIPQPENPMITKACTQEAKLCPDGFSVGRTGPNCEFAPCPGEIKVGGNCEFDKFSGKCTITSLTNTDIKFMFKPDSPIEHALWLEGSEKKELVESKSVLGTDTENHKKGDIIDCEVNLESHGTCTPIIFKFTN